MNQKVKVSIIIVILIMLMIEVVSFFYKKNMSGENHEEVQNSDLSDQINYKIIDSGYISDFDNIILSNMDEYHDFMSDSEEWGKEYKLELSSDKYDEGYFENKSIGLIYINTGSSMNELTGIEISNNNNTLIVKPNIKWAKGIVTDDITGKLIVVEVDKNITEIDKISSQ